MTEWRYIVNGVNVAIAECADGEIDNNEGIARIGDALAKVPDDIRDIGLDELIEEMQWARTDEEPVSETYFNMMLSAMYDWADANQVWIEPVAAIDPKVVKA